MHFLLICLTCLFLLTFLVGNTATHEVSTKSKDLCIGLENVPGIPKLYPEKAVIFRRGKSHAKNIKGFELMAQELNMTVEFSHLSIPNYADIVWTPSTPIDVNSSQLTISGPEFDVFPSDKRYSGKNCTRYTVGHAFYTSLSDWNLEVHRGMGGWRYPMVAFKFAVDIEKFNPFVWNVTADETAVKPRLGGFVYFKRRQKSVLEKIKLFLQARGLAEHVEYFIYGEK